MTEIILGTHPGKIRKVKFHTKIVSILSFLTFEKCWFRDNYPYTEWSDYIKPVKITYLCENTVWLCPSTGYLDTWREQAWKAQENPSEIFIPVDRNNIFAISPGKKGMRGNWKLITFYISCIHPILFFILYFWRICHQCYQMRRIYAKSAAWDLDWRVEKCHWRITPIERIA